MQTPRLKLDIEDYDLNDPAMYPDEDYNHWREEMHADPYEVLDDFPVLVSEGDAEENE